VFQTRAVFFRQQLVPPLIHVMPRRNVITGRLTGTYHTVTLQRSATTQTQSKGVFDLAKPKPVSTILCFLLCETKTFFKTIETILGHGFIAFFSQFGKLKEETWATFLKLLRKILGRLRILRKS